MSEAQELLILAVQTKTRLRFIGKELYIFEGDALPKGSVERLLTAKVEVAALAKELFADELSAADDEEIGRVLHEQYLEEHAEELEREAEELAAHGVCPSCKGTGYALDEDGIPNEVCTDCYEYRHRSPDDSAPLGEPDATNEAAEDATGVVPAIAGPTGAFADPDVDGTPSPTPEVP